MPRLVVVELNEIPPRLMEDFANKFPSSSIAKLQESSMRITTVADDIDESSLYPAQSWASMNSGVAYKDHQVLWYNDSQEKAPNIWDTLAKNHKVGVVASIHSSHYKNKSSFEFLIPDAYSKSNYAQPDFLKGFQKFKIRKTFQSGRVANYGISFEDIGDILSFVRLLSFKTFKETALSVAHKLVFKRNERLRNVEFLLHADIFLHLLKTQSADINVFFTNHIASQMHRYMGAKYATPEVRQSCGAKWVKKYESEIEHAMVIFDQYLGRLLQEIDLDKDRLVICSSMGQAVIENYNSDGYLTIYVSNPESFWRTIIGDKFEYVMVGAMVPQLTIELANSEIADNVVKYLKALKTVGLSIELYRSVTAVTISVRFDSQINEQFSIQGIKVSNEQLGLSVNHEDSKNTGKHIPEGILWIAGADIVEERDKIISYLNYVNIIKGLVDSSQPFRYSGSVKVAQVA